MFLLQLSGFPGCGKTTTAGYIARSHGAVHLDKDVIKTSLLKGGLDNNQASSLAYDVMFDLANSLLKQGKSVILDSPCFYPEILDQGRDLCEAHGVAFKYIECYMEDFKELERRIHQRDNMLSQISQVKEEAFLRAQGKSAYPDVAYLRLNTGQEVNWEAIDSYLLKEI